MSARNRLIPAYQKYKADARGWGVPDFGDFRERLVPLRARRQWSEADMMYVMTLEEEGAGFALQNFFGVGKDSQRGNPAARDILGEDEKEPEPMSKDELDSHMRSLIRDCLRSGWSPGEFMSFIDYLDSDKTPADLADGSASGSASSKTATAAKDQFAEAYRRAGKGYQRHVREMLARAADGVRQAAKSAADG